MNILTDIQKKGNQHLFLIRMLSETRTNEHSQDFVYLRPEASILLLEMVKY